MGTTFCNLFFRDEDADTLKAALGKKARFLTGLNGWSMALSEERDPLRLMRAAEKAAGDVLVFVCFDDECFELSLLQAGRRAAAVGSEGKGKKLSLLAGLLPDDPDALKKLRALGDCESLAEKISLLEETFGLPFGAMYEGEAVAPVRRGRKTWDAVRARRDALRKMSARFQIKTLDRAAWPDPVRFRTDLCDHLRGKAGPDLFRLIGDLPRRQLSPGGSPFLILLPMNVSRPGQPSSRGYNAVLAADDRKRETAVFSFPFFVGEPLMMNRRGFVVCESLMRKSVVCLDRQGVEQWRFSPGLVPLQKLFSLPTDREEIVLYSSSLKKTTNDRIWRVSPDDGSVLTERVLPGEDDLRCLRRCPGMECFVCCLSGGGVALLDRDFNEIRRFQPDNDIRPDTVFFSGHCLFAPVPREKGGCDLLRLDLIGGDKKTIRPETPVPMRYILSDGLLAGFTDTGSGSTLILCDEDGKIVSEHRFRDALIGIWEENGLVFGAALRRDAFYEVPQRSAADLLTVFTITAKPERR